MLDPAPGFRICLDWCAAWVCASLKLQGVPCSWVFEPLPQSQPVWLHHFLVCDLGQPVTRCTWVSLAVKWGPCNYLPIELVWGSSGFIYVKYMSAHESITIFWAWSLDFLPNRLSCSLCTWQVSAHMPPRWRDHTLLVWDSPNNADVTAFFPIRLTLDHLKNSSILDNKLCGHPLNPLL